MSVPPPVRRSFSDEPGPGTFHSLGDLPKRSRVACPHRSPVFHIAARDDDDDDSSSLDEHPTAAPATVHFPSSESSPPQSPSSSSSSSSSSSTPRPTSPCSQLSRGTSTPILLANGKPLKPSLKSSSSSPAMLIPTHMHLRARSEPSTPKNVRFPEKDYGLATVRVYNRSARPAALSSPVNGDGDETETEGEDAHLTRFPFPSFSPVCNYEIDPTTSSPVPSYSPPHASLILESLELSSSSFSSATSTKPFLAGSVLVRNLAFEKHVTVRFTLDDWQTVSEVGARYSDSISYPPSRILSSPPADNRERGWDRFKFTIRLGDYAPSLSTRTLWLAARYRTHSTYPEPGFSLYGPGGEWWDNNDGGNYRIGFKPVTTAPTPIRTKLRRETISAPISSYRPPQPPVTCKEHVLGLMLSSVSTKPEKRSMPLRTGKLDLCNYAPPTVRPPSSISIPSVPSLQVPSPSSTDNAGAPPSDEESTPPSSTLSTPSVSPTIVPRVIIGGQPATSTNEEEEENVAYSKPGYIADWDWSAFSKGRGPLERPRDVPSSPDGFALSDGNSLYDAFVTQWCFAREPSPSHHAYDDGGIMT